MGGHVIGRSLEEYPKYYDGALPMCGVLGDQRLFDYFLSYNLVAQDLADVPAYPTPADYLTADVPVIQQELGLAGLRPGGPDTTNALGKQLRSITTNLTGGERPGADQAFAVWKDFPFTLASPDNGGSLSQNPGRVAQNLFTRYSPNTPVDVNSTVERVAPTDLRSFFSPRLTQIPLIKGRPARAHPLPARARRPLRAVLDGADLPSRGRPAPPVRAARAARDPGRRALRVHPDRGRHRVGRPDPLGGVAALGAGPAGDDVLTPSVVAAPTYGCRFTDPTAYASPAAFPTRPLYARCTP